MFVYLPVGVGTCGRQRQLQIPWGWSDRDAVNQTLVLCKSSKYF